MLIYDLSAIHSFIFQNRLTTEPRGDWSQLTLGDSSVTPWTSHQFITGLTSGDKQTIHAPIHTYGQFRITNEPNLHVFGLWEEARAP